MKLHLPLLLRSALLVLCTLLASNQSFAQTLTSDVVATDEDAARSITLKYNDSGKLVDTVYYDCAMYVYERAVSNKVISTYIPTVSGVTICNLTDLDGAERQYSYSLNLHQLCPWVMSYSETSLTFTHMKDVSVIGSSQLVLDNGEYRQMKGSAGGAKEGKLILTITDSDSFTFAEAKGDGNRGSLTTSGSVTLSGVDLITIRDNKEGHLIYKGSISVNDAETFLYTGNAVHLANAPTSLSFSDIDNAEFTGNTSTIFYITSKTVANNSVFDNIKNLTFSDNYAATDTLFGYDYHDSSTGWVTFSNCDKVKITNNRTSEGCLFGDATLPEFVDCGTVEICANKSADGAVIAREMSLSGIAEAVCINDNIMTNAPLFWGNRILHANAGDVCVMGSAESWIPLLEMKGNQANGAIARGLLGGFLDASYITTIDLSNNVIRSSNTIERILSSFAVNNIGDIIIANNEGYAVKSASLISGQNKANDFGYSGSYLHNFAKLTIKGNKLSSEKDGVGLFGGVVALVGRDDMTSELVIRENRGESLYTSWAGAPSVEIANLNNFDYVHNTFTNVISPLGEVNVSNVNTFIVESNATLFEEVNNEKLSIGVVQDGVLKGGIFAPTGGINVSSNKLKHSHFFDLYSV